MELELEEKLKEVYNKRININVKFKEFRHYEVYLKFLEDTAKIDFTYDNHFTFEININSLCNFIDKVIVEYYRREKNYVGNNLFS